MNTIQNKGIRLVLLSSLLFSFACSSPAEKTPSPEQPPIPVSVAGASFRETGGIYFSGRIEAGQTAFISTRIMGTIEKIHVSEGDRVKAGQLLVSIGNQDILAKQKQVEAMVSEAEAALQNARKDEERFRNLYARESVSPKELENVILQHRSAQSRYETARQMLRETEVSMAYTRLKAPFNGVVTQKQADEGSMANPGMPLLTVEQGGKLQVSATISENDISHVRMGDKVSLTVKSAGKTLAGYIAGISPSSQQTGGQYMVKIALPDSAQNGLFSGMFVHAFIQANSDSPESAQETSPMVPLSAVIQRDQLTGLYILSGKQTAVLRWVRLGKIRGDQVEVLSGLAPGERFIRQADGKLYNGVAVTEKTNQ